jgi:hypothetical protein
MMHYTFPALLLACLSSVATAATLQEQTASRLDQTRAIRAGQDAATTARYNADLDAAWRFFISQKPDVLPILRTELQAEMARQQPNDMVLLDTGFFLQTHGGVDDKAAAREALFRLNPRADVVEANQQQLFAFTHAVAQDRDARVLDLIGRVFMPSSDTIFIPQHALELDGTLTCVFLYGAYGADAEPAIRAHLRVPALAKRALEVLVWLGSPESVSEAAGAFRVYGDSETFERVTTFMMQAGGPAGRDFMLTIAPDTLVPRNRRAILDTGLDDEAIIAKLLSARRRAFARISDEALSEVETLNTMLNAMRYRITPRS